jgi:hypothetical protein
MPWSGRGSKGGEEDDDEGVGPNEKALRIALGAFDVVELASSPAPTAAAAAPGTGADDADEVESSNSIDDGTV